ncbi:DNA repair protein RecN [Mesoaciditoga sp.]
MLAEIHVKNFVLFNEISLEFSKGLNVVTGETGAGKSLFLSALRALYGERPSTLMEKSEVEGLFETDNGEKIVSVKFSPSRTSAKINGSLVTIAQLRHFIESQLVIHSQGAAGILRDPKTHMSFVDLFEPKINGILSSYRKLFQEYVQIEKTLQREELSKIEEEIKEIEKDVERIERALISDEEYEEMLSEYKRLSNAQQIIQNVQEMLYFISGEGGLEDSITNLVRKAKSLRTLDEKAEVFLENAQTIEDEIMELEKEIENYGMEQDVNEERVVELERKIEDIERIRRRYGPTFEDVRKRFEELQSHMIQLSEKARVLKKAKKRLKELKDEMTPLATNIRELRKEAAKKLLDNTEKNLHDLGMKDAKVEFLHTKTDFGENGIDSIEFIGTMNPGLGSVSLSKIASGGEMARFYLALEAALGRKLPVETVVFDEVASGVGVRTADVVAEKLKEISKDTQLIVITHMPQIAAIADKHFKVEKHVKDGKTYSVIRELDGKMRKEEIKEMFGKIPKGVKK